MSVTVHPCCSAVLRYRLRRTIRPVRWVPAGMCEPFTASTVRNCVLAPLPAHAFCYCVLRSVMMPSPQQQWGYGAAAHPAATTGYGHYGTACNTLLAQLLWSHDSLAPQIIPYSFATMSLPPDLRFCEIAFSAHCSDSDRSFVTTFSMPFLEFDAANQVLWPRQPLPPLLPLLLLEATVDPKTRTTPPPPMPRTLEAARR